MRILSVGEILWDVFGEREHLGGAPLNLAFHLARLGHEVALLTAVGEDVRGNLALEQAKKAGVDIRFIQKTKLPTGVARVSVNNAGHSFHLERPAAYDLTTLLPCALAEIDRWNPDWICYGTLFHKTPATLRISGQLHDAFAFSGRFYDINLRPGQYTAPLVQYLAGMADILKLSAEEAPAVAELLCEEYPSRETFVKRLASRFGHKAVCLTLGKDGCAVLWGGIYAEYEGPPVAVADTVGAGDAFSAAFLHGWTSGWSARATAEFANKVGGLVASRPGATPEWSVEDLP